MRRRGTALGVVCCGITLLAGSGSAVGSVFPAQPPMATLQVRGTHRYQIGISISRQYASLDARLGRGFYDASYTSFHGGSIDRHGIRASFGDRGRVAVRFDGNGKVVRRPGPKNCEGGERVIRHGIFEGVVRFHGERGFTEVDAKRVRGVLESTTEATCHAPKSSGAAKHPQQKAQPQRKPEFTTRFEAQGSSGPSQVAFSAVAFEREPVAEFVAFSFEHEQGMTITRSAFAPGSETNFAVAPDLNSATFTPPAPFSGSGTFHRVDAYESRWDGPLSVSFPGKPNVPLTGRSFTWSLKKERVSDQGFIFGFSFSF